MTRIAAVLLTVLLVGCTSSLEHRFTLIETRTGHEFGPFRYGVGEFILINGHHYRLQPAGSPAETKMTLARLEKTILPDLTLRQAGIRDAVDFIISEAGVSAAIKILRQDRQQPADPFSDTPADPAGWGPMLTLTATNISAAAALNLVCSAAEAAWDIEDGIVVVKDLNTLTEEPDWKYDGGFHKLIDLADKVVIRNGGFDCCSKVDGQDVIATITNRKDIIELNGIIEFDTNQTSFAGCMCCGSPGIDWYVKDYRIALTSVQHGIALRWKDFPGDALLTKASSRRLASRLLDLKTPDEHGELKAILDPDKKSGK